jgi:hypothetical protein
MWIRFVTLARITLASLAVYSWPLGLLPVFISENYEALMLLLRHLERLRF